jgi:hypothetical protein
MLLFFGAVSSLTMLDVCERLSAGWTRRDAVQLLRRWMDKQGRARAPTRSQPNNRTLQYSITSGVTTKEHRVNSEEQSSPFSSWFVTIHVTSDIANKKKGVARRNIAILQFYITKNVQ